MNSAKKRLKASVPIAMLLLLPALSPASTWSGGSGNWSSTGMPGWVGGVPNAAGAVATKTDSTGATITQDTVAGVTLGTLSLGSNADIRLRIIGNTITLNQDGAGSGYATISNTNAAVGSTNQLAVGVSLALADNLLISNTGGSTGILGSGSILMETSMTGTGNVTFSNVSNNINAGAIHLGGDSTYSGSVLIQKGAVTWRATSSFGSSSNVITLGSAAGGSASLVGTHATRFLANNIVVAAGTGGTLLLGNADNTAGSAGYTGGITLNGNLTLTSAKSGGANDIRYTGVISGAGGLVIAGSGETQFGDGTANLTNTYHSNTTLTQTASLVLADNAKLTFYIGSTGVNNMITGSGQRLTLDGDFVFDLSGAASVGSWKIVDVGNLTATFSSTFTVVGFTENANVWTKTSGDTTYTFSEATGVLTSVPEPSASALAVVGLSFVAFRLRRRARN